MRPSQAPPAVQAGAGAARSTRFYVGVLAVCLVVFVGAGVLIARSMRGPAPASPTPGAASTAGPAVAQPAGRVITISPVEMTDDVDGGSTK
jgi:hypothetical protein